MSVPSTSESLLGRVFDQYQNLMQIARCMREMARLSQFDYREPCYRYLIAVALDPRLDVDAFVTTLQ